MSTFLASKLSKNVFVETEAFVSTVRPNVYVEKVTPARNANDPSVDQVHIQLLFTPCKVSSLQVIIISLYPLLLCNLGIIIQDYFLDSCFPNKFLL